MPRSVTSENSEVGEIMPDGDWGVVATLGCRREAANLTTQGQFWRLGAIFGAIYLAVLLGLGLPYLVALTR